MKFFQVEYLLKGIAEVKQVIGDRGQDPFVMYENDYVLQTKGFGSHEEIQDFFRGKQVAIGDCNDDFIEGIWNVKFWIHENKVRS